MKKLIAIAMMCSFMASILPAAEMRNPNMFYVGDQVTCVYVGIMSWTDGTEFVKNIPMNCEVIKASEPWDHTQWGEGKYYQHIQVDCTAGVKAQTGKPGTGLVAKHPLNYKKPWYTSRDCYKMR